MMMMNFSKQTRCLSQAAQSLLTNFEQSAFAPNATIAFGSADKLHRVPFSGKQSATDFFANLDASLSKFAVAASKSSGDDSSFSAVLQIDLTATRTNKDRSFDALAFGEVADGKVTSLVVRPESGVLEEAFDAHGPPKMGTENQWDDSRSQ
eukprot:Rhum_TRINITY_DN14832_c25_g1::Rhum_TRINITY_DN14832_c25_g1_i1::g.124913::m.124913